MRKIILAMTAAVMMVVVSGCGNVKERTAEKQTAALTEAAFEPADLVIPISEVTEMAKF